MYILILCALCACNFFGRKVFYYIEAEECRNLGKIFLPKMKFSAVVLLLQIVVIMRHDHGDPASLRAQKLDPG
jgi:hypothetical protein